MDFSYNTLTNKPYSKKSQEIWNKSFIKKNTDIVKSENRDKYKNLLKNCHVLLFTGQTGSGKSTHLPVLTGELFNFKKKVICTQPKRLSVELLSEFVAKFMDVELGEEIGFKHRERQRLNDDTKVIYATDGYFLNEFSKSPELNEYCGIVLDEAHERSSNTDIIINLLAELLSSGKRNDLKVVIMSAGADMYRFKVYFENFGLTVAEMELGKSTNIVTPSYYMITEEKSGWEKYFLDFEISDNDIEKECAKRILKIYADPNKLIGHVLVFLTGKKQIDELFKLLYNDSKKINNSDIYKLSASTPKEEQDKITEELDIDSHSIILSTNVAEASVTIKNVSYIIETGRQKVGHYDPEDRKKVLNTTFISKGNVKQRMGRTGRTVDGIVYFMYTHEQFLNMNDHIAAKIKDEMFLDNALKLLEKSANNFEDLLVIVKTFLDKPDIRNIEDAYSVLANMNIIDNSNLGNLTQFGKELYNIEEDELFSKILIFYSYLYDCYNDIFKYIAILSSTDYDLGKFFYKDMNDPQYKKKYDIMLQKFMGRDPGDHFLLINIFDYYESKKEDFNNKYEQETKEDIEENRKMWENELERKYYLKSKILNRALDKYEKLKNISSNKNFIKFVKSYKEDNRILYKNEFYGIEWLSSPISENKNHNIMRAILSAYFMNIIIRKENQTDRNKDRIKSLKSGYNSDLLYFSPANYKKFNQNKNENIGVYYSLFQGDTPKTNVNIVSIIDDVKNNYWILEGGLLYYILFDIYDDRFQRNFLKNLYQEIEEKDLIIVRDPKTKKKIEIKDLIKLFKKTYDEKQEEIDVL